MICLPIPEAIANTLAVPDGEEPDSMHVTLAYIPGVGGNEDARIRIQQAISPLTETIAPLRGCIGGMGRFNASETSDGKDVLYASFNSPGLEALRRAVVNAIEQAGFEISRKHGFTPHITLKYVEPSDQSSVRVATVPDFEIDCIAIADSTSWSEFRTNGTIVLKGAPMETLPCVCEPFDIHQALQEETGWQIGGTIKDGSRDEKFIFGNLVFDINRAREIAGEESNALVQVSPDWSKQINIDQMAALRGNREGPVFIAIIPLAEGMLPLLIDGHHRMFRACQEGKETIEAFIFPPGQTLSLIETRPDIKMALNMNFRAIRKSQPSSSGVHVNSPSGDDDEAPPVAEPTLQSPGWAEPPENNQTVAYSPKYKKAPKAKKPVKAPADNSYGATTKAMMAAEQLAVGAIESTLLMMTEKQIPIAKIDGRKQIVYGVILEPHTEDLQGDVMTEDEIEKTAHDYMENARNVKRRHSTGIEAFPVESFIAPQEMTYSGGPYGTTTVAKGSWVLGIKVRDPEEWAKVESGEYTGFSVGGMGVRDAV